MPLSAVCEELVSWRMGERGRLCVKEGVYTAQDRAEDDAERSVVDQANPELVAPDTIPEHHRTGCVAGQESGDAFELTHDEFQSKKLYGALERI